MFIFIFSIYIYVYIYIHTYVHVIYIPTSRRFWPSPISEVWDTLVPDRRLHGTVSREHMKAGQVAEVLENLRIFSLGNLGQIPWFFCVWKMAMPWYAIQNRLWIGKMMVNDWILRDPLFRQTHVILLGGGGGRGEESLENLLGQEENGNYRSRSSRVETEHGKLMQYDAVVDVGWPIVRSQNPGFSLVKAWTSSYTSE